MCHRIDTQLAYVIANVTMANNIKGWLTDQNNNGGADFTGHFPATTISPPGSSTTKAVTKGEDKKEEEEEEERLGCRRNRYSSCCDVDLVIAPAAPAPPVEIVRNRRRWRRCGCCCCCWLLLLYGSEHLLTLSPHPLLLCSAITSIDKTLEETQAIYNTVNTVVTTTLTPAVDAFNTSDPNSMAEKAVKIVDNVLDKLYDANRKVIVYELTMRDYTDEYRGYLSYKTQAMSGLFALPALFFILCIIINYYCSKRSWHLCCSMCVAYICLILFGIVALVISTLSVVTNLACDNRDWFVHKVPTKHMTVNGADFTIGPDTVNAILHCPAGINATADNNFVDILGVGKIFNISKQVDQGMAQVETMKSSFTPDTSIRKGLAKLTSVSNSSTFNVSKVAPIGPFISQLESFITTLPPQGMSKTDTTAQQQLMRVLPFLHPLPTTTTTTTPPLPTTTTTTTNHHHDELPPTKVDYSIE